MEHDIFFQGKKLKVLVSGPSIMRCTVDTFSRFWSVKKEKKLWEVIKRRRENGLSSWTRQVKFEKRKFREKLSKKSNFL